MPQVSAEVWVPVSPETAFAVSQTTGELRCRWDVFIRRQHFLDGAAAPDKGVRTFTRARIELSMVSEYVSYRPPTSVGMMMTQGPWFFDRFGGGWRFIPQTVYGIEGTRVVWKYTYSIRPTWLRPAGEALGQVVLGREIKARIHAFAKACSDEHVLRQLS